MLLIMDGSTFSSRSILRLVRGLEILSASNFCGDTSLLRRDRVDCLFGWRLTTFSLIVFDLKMISGYKTIFFLIGLVFMVFAGS